MSGDVVAGIVDDVGRGRAQDIGLAAGSHSCAAVSHRDLVMHNGFGAIAGGTHRVGRPPPLLGKFFRLVYLDMRK